MNGWRSSVLATMGVLLAACGSGPTEPTSPSPAIGEPTTLAFVHVLTDDALSTWAVVPATGLLSPVDTQRLPGKGVLLAADPRGRFVYVLFQADQRSWLVRSYAVAPVSGVLTLANQQPAWSWAAMVADGQGIYFSWQEKGAHGSTYAYAGAFAVDSDGFLDRQTWQNTTGWPGHSWGTRLCAEPEGRYLLQSSGGECLVALVLDRSQSDQWKRIYANRLAGGCIAEGTGPIADVLHTGRFVLVSSTTGALTTLELDPESRSLVRRGWFPRAAGPRMAFAAGILAVAGNQNVHGIETYALGSAGELTPLYTATEAGLAPEALAFHPSGRFLYASGTALRTFTVERHGALRPFGQDWPEAAHGRIVVTAPESRAE